MSCATTHNNVTRSAPSNATKPNEQTRTNAPAHVVTCPMTIRASIDPARERARSPLTYLVT
eukprot:4023862-Lingulodinium_polyedra.AAC.1